MKKKIVGISKWIALIGTILVFSFPMYESRLANALSFYGGIMVSFCVFVALEQLEARL